MPSFLFGASKKWFFLPPEAINLTSAHLVASADDWIVWHTLACKQLALHFGGGGGWGVTRSHAWVACRRRLKGRELFFPPPLAVSHTHLFLLSLASFTRNGELASRLYTTLRLGALPHHPLSLEVLVQNCLMNQEVAPVKQRTNKITTISSWKSVDLPLP